VSAGIDVPALVSRLLQRTTLAPYATTVAAKLQRPLLSNCYPPLVAPDLGMPRAGVQTVATSSSQLLPLVGWVRVG
jgi:hypothetical protein